MTRVVLVGASPTDWRLYRQLQWVAEVRRRPDAASWPRRHFDLEDAAARRCFQAWDEARHSEGAALAVLRSEGAIEVHLG